MDTNQEDSGRAAGVAPSPTTPTVYCRGAPPGGAVHLRELLARQGQTLEIARPAVSADARAIQRGLRDGAKVLVWVLCENDLEADTAIADVLAWISGFADSRIGDTIVFVPLAALKAGEYSRIVDELILAMCIHLRAGALCTDQERFEEVLSRWRRG